MFSVKGRVAAWTLFVEYWSQSIQIRLQPSGGTTLNYLSITSLASYWSDAEISVNVLIFMNMLGSLLLGLVVGYERYYHGRAAGMRTYGLVCMACAALVVVSGYPGFWFGGNDPNVTPVYPGHVIQGIVTGIGFLGAGVIMKDGYSITGLTTAASIWASSAIGVLVGFGLYGAAISLTLLTVCSTMWISRLENSMPSRPAIAIEMLFRQGFVPRLEVLRRVARERGYDFATSTLTIGYKDGRADWRFVIVVINRKLAAPIAQLAEELAGFDGVDEFRLATARN